MAGRTAKGNVKVSQRKKSATLSGGRFPIFDKRSALAALHLIGHANSREEKLRIIARAAKFAPDAAKASRERLSKD